MTANVLNSYQANKEKDFADLFYRYGGSFARDLGLR
jgi:hypothetical protein